MGALDKKYRDRLPYDYENRERGTVPPDTTREPFRWVSEVAYKNLHRIVARGYDTTELVEAGYGLADMIFVDFQARIPLKEEAEMLNYVMILGLEDGLSSPAVVARAVSKSHAYLTQAAGASILAFGHAYGAYSAFGNMLRKCLDRAEKEGRSAAEMAELLVRENQGAAHLGVSNLMLKDPAAKRTFARAEKFGLARRHIPFMKEVVAAAQRLSPEPVDLDMLGALGATMMDLHFSPEAAWGILAVTRAFAAGAHGIEEIERMGCARLGECLTPKEDYDGPLERAVPSLEERATTAKPGQTRSLEEWREAVDERAKTMGSGFRIVEEIEDPRKIGKVAKKK